MVVRKLLLIVLLAAAVGSVVAAESPVARDSSTHIAARIVKSEIPVLVDFWASWCAPCRMLNPIIKELESEYKGRVLFVKVDIDTHRALSSYFKVNSVPSVFVIRNKAVIKTLPGLQTRDLYRQALEAALEKAALAQPDPA